MSTDFWSEDDRPASPPARRWRWWHFVALGLVILLAVVAFAGFAAPELFANRWHNWQVQQLRKGILSGDVSPEQLRDDLMRRSDGLYFAERLSEDPDPRVRAAVVDRLIARGTPVKKQEPGDGPIDHMSTTLEFGADQAMMRLLDDADPTVRKKAIRAVSSIQENLSFTEKLTSILETGPVDERLIVCEYLAAWNGNLVLKTFADPRQPKEVRLAALRGADKFGWARVVEFEGDFINTMKQVQKDPDAELRQAATEALRHSRTAAPN
jgi:hypothetical protein